MLIVLVWKKERAEYMFPEIISQVEQIFSEVIYNE